MANRSKCDLYHSHHYFAVQMAGIVTFLLTVVYAQSALLRLREYYNNKGKLLPEQHKKKRLRHIVTGLSYVLSWLVPLLVVLPVTEALVGLESTDKGCWCIVDFFNLRPDNGDLNTSSPFNTFAIIQADMIGSFFLGSALLIIVYYGITLWYIRKVYAFQANQQGSQQRSAKLRRIIRTVMIRLSCFILIFIACGAPTFAGAVDVWSEGSRLHLSEKPDRIILYIHAVLAPMQGFWNAIVYGWSRKEFRRAVRIHGSERSASSSNYQSLNNSRVDQGNNASPTQ
ncbi:hypothetical protein GBAR_LOCUS30029 [Geodia barretti]|uniref:Uncharacterized protein n=1 Tax=Geodia barretti TaxID=519541 RepID=A0AA35XDR8_GEOBA|nr:hypothetical protein GBAR_LOCUS30029 [Geodia barretti]